jgi:hypothetical protein
MTIAATTRIVAHAASWKATELNSRTDAFSKFAVDVHASEFSRRTPGASS